MKISGDKKLSSFFLPLPVILLLSAAFNYFVDTGLLGNNQAGVYFVLKEQVKDAILTLQT